MGPLTEKELATHRHAALLVLQGAEQGTRLYLREPRYTLGRGIGNGFRIPDSEVSRVHASLHYQDGEYWLRDEGSSNGTFVNGGRIVERVALRDGDTIQVGGTTLRFSRAASMGDSTLADRVKFFSDSADEEQRSSILSHATVEESKSILSETSAVASPDLAHTLANLRALYRISEETVSSTHSLDQILQRVLDEAIEAIGAERGCLMLRNPETGDIEPHAVSVTSEIDARHRIPVSRTIVDYVLRQRQGVRTSDARSDRRFTAGQSILREGIREAICVPMQGKYDLVGVIYVDRTSRDPAFTDGFDRGGPHFDEEQLRLLMAVGRQSALAVENHRYQEALIQAERLAAVGHTVAAISHHIKNILQGIRGGTYLIDHGLKGAQDDVVRQGLDIIERNQTRIYNLVLDMLSYSKEREPLRVTADLVDTVREVVDMVRPRAAEIGVSLELECADEIPTSYYDEEAIHRAILNLVTNALDVMEDQEPGHVWIHAGYDPKTGRLYVSVADDGPGIPESERELIFQAFHSTKGARGTGLGLAVSRKIMLEHEGELLLESVLGKGSRFTLSWPRVESDEHRGSDSSIVQ